jgi:hypothetical protein
MPDRQTVYIADDSDRGGLTVGQKIRVRGFPGYWMVERVHPKPVPIAGLVAPRGYDVVRDDRPRKERRKEKANGRAQR